MPWPGQACCAVSLTIDLDGELVWLNKVSQNPAFGSPVIRSMGRFGPQVGAPRLLDLLDRYGIKACFFIPGKNLEAYPDLAREILSRGHEIGFHGHDHRNPATMTLEEEREDFARALAAFDRIVGQRPLGYRSPALEMSGHTWDLLAANGFLYDSGLMDADSPYLLRAGGRSLVEIPVHWLLDDWVHFGFNMYPPLPYMSGISSQEKVYEIWSAEFEGLYQAGGHFVLCLHPQLMGRLSRLNMLERLIRLIRGRPDVWIARPVEVARYVLESQGAN